jgi:hypothetical protein
MYVELERIVSGTSNTRAELLKKLKRYAPELMIISDPIYI